VTSVDSPAGFDFAPRTRVVFGHGVFARLGELARGLGARRVMVVTDPGLVAAGHAARAEELLGAAGCAPELWAGARGEPDALDAARCAAAMGAAFGGAGPEALVALGGGSSIDLAKAGAMLRANGGRMQDYWGYGKTHAPLLPILAVPTTAGTGSEVQSYALIADETTHQKMACGAADAAPRVALLDPELTLSLPREVTALSGLDALGHALETAVTRKRTPLSDMLSRAAFRALAPAFARALAEPADREARAGMLLGAAWAGLAIEHSMLGAAHSLANPLSARLGLVHGEAVGLALPVVVRFNAVLPEAQAVYAACARETGLAPLAAGDDQAVEALLAFLEDGLEWAGLARLAERGLGRERLPALAEEASRQWTAQFNPRPVDRAAFAGLLDELWRS
jgi:alcohol dehydrogenase class IV